MSDIILEHEQLRAELMNFAEKLKTRNSESELDPTIQFGILYEAVIATDVTQAVNEFNQVLAGSDCKFEIEKTESSSKVSTFSTWIVFRDNDSRNSLLSDLYLSISGYPGKQEVRVSPAGSKEPGISYNISDLQKSDFADKLKLAISNYLLQISKRALQVA